MLFRACVYIFLILTLNSSILSAQKAIQSWSGVELSPEELWTSELTVFLFLSPECPLCENYSATLKVLRSEFDEEEVAFVGIFSGEWYSKEEITTFLARYQPPVTPILDPGFRLQQFFSATVTPEAVVTNDQGEILYQGKIDNWIVSLGKKRTVVNQYYLRDALRSLLEGRNPEIAKTEPIGCFIE